MNGAQSLVLAPVSPAIATLLQALQAQIASETATVQVLFVVDDDDVRYTKARYREKNGFRSIECSRGDSAGLRLQTPTCADPASPGRPGVWYGSEERVDSKGRAWKHFLDCDFVMDDFGTLVPVAAG